MTDDIDWDLLSSYGGLLSLATLSIYIGSYASIPVGVKTNLGIPSQGAYFLSCACRLRPAGSLALQLLL
jgi:hypothetical protein